MAKKVVAPLERQLARVHRRLLVQKLVNALAVSWCAALAVCAIWLLVQPYAWPTLPLATRGPIIAGALGVATLIGFLYSYLKAPSWLVAALSLDSEFQLRERVTTSLTLDPALHATPAGRALLADVNEKLGKLDVGEKFPVKLSWTATLVPVFAGILALVAFFYQPNLNQASAQGKDDGQEPLANATEVEKKVKEITKKLKDKSDLDKAKSEDLKGLEGELDKIANRPFDNKEQVRERIKEMTALEELMKQQEKALAEKNQSLKQQLQRLDQAGQKSASEGPAKDLQKALSEGKMDKAREEMEKLAKKMAANQLTEKEKEQLKKQLEDLQKKLDRVANQRDKEDALRKMNLDPETLKRELQNLKEDSQKLQNLQQMAKDLQKAQQALKEGDMKACQSSMESAADAMAKMEGDDKDLDELREQLKSLQDAKGSCCEGAGEQQIDPQSRDIDEDSDNAAQGAGRRPLGKAGAFREYDAKGKGDFDAKGKKLFDGYAPGQGFKRKGSAELVGEVKQASQDAPEAMETQRIPKSAKDMAKGYFQRMREQAEKQEGTPK